MYEQIRYNLAKDELKRLNLNAQLIIKEELPSFEIEVKDQLFTIYAPNSLELLYGVYTLAEKFGGWSFWNPGKETFNTNKVFTPQDGIVVKACQPLLENRGFIQEFPFNDQTKDLFDWMVKNKLNYLLVWMKYYDDLSSELKEYALVRGIAIESGHHNFNYWIPGRKYGKSNPEFFAEINGMRIQSSDGKAELLLSEQLCTTNKQLRQEIAKNMLEYCEKNPEVKTISLVPNDGFGWCECSECSKFYDKSKKGDFYSLSTHVYVADKIYHNMVEEIAQIVGKVRPDIKITLCAYINYCRPSKNFKLTPNLGVHFAPYWRCINHTIDDENCPVNSFYARDIKEWCSVKEGGKVNIYEYYMGVNFYLSLPMIHFEEMFHEIQWYNKNNVDGVLTQFHIPHWSVYGLNYCLMAKAARGEDAKVAIDSLFDEVFGDDAKLAKEFYHEVKLLQKKIGTCHIPYPRSILRRTKAEDFAKLIPLAQELAKKSPNDSFRQDLVTWTTYMLKFKELFDKYQDGQLTLDNLKEFLDFIHSYRESRVFVHDRFDMYFKALETALTNNTKWIHFNLPWEDDYILQQEDKFLF